MGRINILFYQHFGQPRMIRGAHFKSYDFFRYLSEHEDFEPVIAFDEDSYWHPDLPWYRHFDKMPTLNDVPVRPDMYFLNSGKDWLRYQCHRPVFPDVPLVSPVNHFKAVNPHHPAGKLLQSCAVRLCPSPELYEAVKNHPSTQGPVVYMPNGVSIDPDIVQGGVTTPVDVLIVGQKNPGMAKQLAEYCAQKGLSHHLLVDWVPKSTFQRTLANARITIHLPKEVEAHYIPAIESMMLGSLVVMPKCVGNLSYAIDGQTCLISEYSLSALTAGLDNALKLKTEQRNDIIQRAKKETNVFSLTQERENLLSAIRLAQQVWR